MKVVYDRNTDTLTVIFNDTPVAESDEDKPGVIWLGDACLVYRRHQVKILAHKWREPTKRLSTVTE